MRNLTILAVGAHPDDIEINCGGTLAKYSLAGAKVIMAHLLNGDKGHYSMDSAALAVMRKKESENSGKIIGAESISLGIPDGQLFPDLETRIKIMDLVRSAKPDIILTHSPQDYMSDHTATAQLVCDASFFAAVPLFKTGRAAQDKVAPIFFMDTVFGVNFLPTEYVDISDTFATKKEMLKQHQSQLIWLKEHNNTDILEGIESVACFRGFQCGVKYAECFQQYQAWGRGVTKRLLP
ncbi:MAG: PIG-L family deacetylase [Candidatus Firestonebacteria bacterium]